MKDGIEERTVRLRHIASRWPRFAWDYLGLARRVSFDESYWTGILSAGLLFSTVYLDILILNPSAGSLPLIGDLGRSSEGLILLAVLVVFNGWVLDRLLAAQTPLDRYEVPWVRAVRMILASIPLLGLAVFPVWQRLLLRRPA